MDSRVHLLPDNIANQIAAGEVIQRPASVVKELVENAIDAGATDIQVIIKDAGKTLIQIIDNGSGMGAVDARMAFERHATSKIREAADLFSIVTMGFRGEALPSIAAVAHVTLQTRMEDAEQGTKLEIEGSKVISQEPVACLVGSNFQIRHLFFNVPARRKFLKADTTEFAHILTELQNIAAVRHQVAFTLIHNDKIQLQISAAPQKQRLLDLFGSRLTKHLLPLHIETPLVTIEGFVTETKYTRKRGACQYFFVNDRFMRHPYFHRMVLNAYGEMIPKGEKPEYFLFLSCDPASIDVNISPTKTEIKFEAENDIGTILFSAIREVLMKGAAMPTLDFDEDRMEIPIADSSRRNAPEPPTSGNFLEVGSRLNDSEELMLTPKIGDTFPAVGGETAMPDIADWDSFYEDFQKRREEMPRQIPLSDREDPVTTLTSSLTGESFEMKSGYDVLPLIYGDYGIALRPEGIAVISLSRARERVLFEQYMTSFRSGHVVSSRLLFPALLELSAEDTALLREYRQDLTEIGFDISDMGQNAIGINAVPDGLPAGGEEEILHDLLRECEQTGRSSREVLSNRLVRTITTARLRSLPRQMTPAQAKQLLEQLFALPEYRVTPSGRQILFFLTPRELAKHLP